MGRKYKQRQRKKHCLDRGETHQWRCNRTSTIDYKQLKVEIKESALQKLQKVRQTNGSEVGGLFTGSEIGTDNYRIGKISDPCIVFNSSSKYGCTRDATLANIFIQQDYETSNHSRYYLGEWHTHPEENPTPSLTDIASIRDVYSKSDLVINGVFLIIIGIKSNYYGYYDGENLHKIDVVLC